MAVDILKAHGTQRPQEFVSQQVEAHMSIAKIEDGIVQPVVPPVCALNGERPPQTFKQKLGVTFLKQMPREQRIVHELVEDKIASIKLLERLFPGISIHMEIQSPILQADISNDAAPIEEVVVPANVIRIESSQGFSQSGNIFSIAKHRGALQEVALVGGGDD